MEQEEHKKMRIALELFAKTSTLPQTSYEVWINIVSIFIAHQLSDQSVIKDIIDTAGKEKMEESKQILLTEIRNTFVTLAAELFSEEELNNLLYIESLPVSVKARKFISTYQKIIANLAVQHIQQIWRN